MYNFYGYFRATDGSISLFSSLLFSTLLGIGAVAFDFGTAYVQKRQVEAAVDLAALAGAARLPDTAAAATAARDSLTENLNGIPDGLAISFGEYRSIGNSGSFIYPPSNRFQTELGGVAPNAIQVQAGVTRSLLFGPFVEDGVITVQARATAQRYEPLVGLGIGSHLLSVNTAQSDSLNAIFGSLLGGTLNLTVSGWQGLLDSRINLFRFGRLALVELGLEAVRVDRLLNTELSLGRLLTLMDRALVGRPTTVENARTALESLGAAAAGDPQIRIGDVLGIESQDALSGLSRDVEVVAFGFASGIVALANRKNGVTVELPVALGGVAADVSARVISPFRPAVLGPIGSEVGTSQVRFIAGLDLNLPTTSIPLLGNTLAARVDLVLDAAIAKVGVTNIDCGTPQSVDLDIRTSAARLRLGEIANPESEVAIVTPAPLVTLSLLGQPIAELRAAADVAVTPIQITRHETGSFEQMRLISVSTANDVQLKAALLDALEIEVKLLPNTLLGSVLNPVLAQITQTVVPSLTTLLSGALDPVLDVVIGQVAPSLGVVVAGADVSVGGVRCSRRSLVAS